MKNSTYGQPPLSKKAQQLATGYKMNQKEISGKYHIYPEQAAAGLWTNPTDLSQYIIDTQLSLLGRSNNVLSKEKTQLRLNPNLDKSAALGVFIKTNTIKSYFGHGGANEGFRCQYYGSLEGGNGVVIMVNSDNGQIVQELINSVVLIYQW